MLIETISSKIVLDHPEAMVPVYSTDGSGCFDFFSAEEGIVRPGNPLVFDTGLIIEVPKGYVLLVFPRSGHGFKYDTRLSNCVGVIDSDYRQHLKVKLTSDETTVMKVSPGDRIAQGMILPYPQVRFLVVQSVNEMTDAGNRTGGMGSTGK